MEPPISVYLSRAAGIVWRTHSCVPRRDFLDAVLCARNTCPQKRRREESRRGTHECVRHIDAIRRRSGWAEENRLSKTLIGPAAQTTLCRSKAPAGLAAPARPARTCCNNAAKRGF